MMLVQWFNFLNRRGNPVMPWEKLYWKFDMTWRLTSLLIPWRNRSSRQRCSMKKSVLRNFAKFTRKHLCHSLFFNKVRPAPLLKKRLWHRCFLVNFANFLRIQNTSGWLLLKKIANLNFNHFFLILFQKENSVLCI